MSSSKDKGVMDDSSAKFDAKFVMEAMMKEFTRKLDMAMEQVNERFDQMSMSQGNQFQQHSGNRQKGIAQQRGARTEDNDYEVRFSEEEDHESDFIHRRQRGHRDRGGRNKEDGNLDSIKMKIPAFQGKSDPEAYLEWETKMEWIFACHNYSELKKVKIAATEFSDYAVTWWDQLMLNRRRYGEHPIETWEEMKTVMKKRFVPTHYYRDIFRNL